MGALPGHFANQMLDLFLRLGLGPRNELLVRDHLGRHGRINSLFQIAQNLRNPHKLILKKRFAPHCLAAEFREWIQQKKLSSYRTVGKVALRWSGVKVFAWLAVVSIPLSVISCHSKLR